MQQNGGADMMTQSALTSVLREVRLNAAFYEQAARRFGHAFAFAELAQTERRHERLLLGLLKTYRIAAPKPPPPLPLPNTLPETLKQSVRLEQHAAAECRHYLRFLKQRDIVDLVGVVKVSAQELHLPRLQKKLGGATSPHLTPAQVRQLDQKLNKRR
jgi:hypothetical protein